MTAEAMAPVLKALLDRLVEKNVAQEVGAKVIDAVGASLVGASLPTFGSLASTVKAGLEYGIARFTLHVCSYAVLYAGATRAQSSCAVMRAGTGVKE